MAFDAFTDKNAVFRRLKARPENKVLVTSPLSSSSSPSPPAAMPSPLRPSLASAAHPIPPPRRPRSPPRHLPLGPLAVSPSIPHILHDSPLAAAMAPKKIREYDSKRLLKEHLKRLAGIDLQILSAQRAADQSSSRAMELAHKVAVLEVECASLHQELQEMEARNCRAQKKPSEEANQVLQMQVWQEEVERARQSQRGAKTKISSLEAEL